LAAGARLPLEGLPRQLPCLEEGRRVRPQQELRDEISKEADQYGANEQIVVTHRPHAPFLVVAVATLSDNVMPAGSAADRWRKNVWKRL
jgi:hypothetical protein